MQLSTGGPTGESDLHHNEYDIFLYQFNFEFFLRLLDFQHLPGYEHVGDLVGVIPRVF